MSQPNEESALVEAAAGGDTTALEQLLSNHFPALERSIGTKIPARARRHFEVEDIVQIVFSEAFRKIGKFQPRGDGSFFGWKHWL